MVPGKYELIPSHVGDFAPRSSGDFFDVARKEAEPFDVAAFRGVVVEGLHAKADAGQLRAFFDRVPDGFGKAAFGEAAHGVSHGAHARKDEGIRVCNDQGIGGNDAFAPSSFQGVIDIGNISCAVIDDDDFHTRTPFVERTLLSFLKDTASPRAWPKPLKRDSTMWWPFTP